MEKSKSNKGWTWGVVILCVLWLPALILYVRHSTEVDYRQSRNLSGDHIHDGEYAAALDVDDFTYEAVIARYGYSTQKLRTKKGGPKYRQNYTAWYPGFTMTYVMVEIYEDKEFKSVPELVQITITDASYRFGESQIGVGSTREEIEAAYAGDQVIEADRLSQGAYYFQSADVGYYGDYWNWIMFSYDTNGRVWRMAYMPSGYW